MFRTSCVRHQEDHLYVQLFMVCFSFHSFMYAVYQVEGCALNLTTFNSVLH